MKSPTQILDAMIDDSSINGQHVDVDGAFGGQCWDLVELFAERCGVPKATSPRPWAIPLGTFGYAKEAWTEFDENPHMQQFFEKIPAGQQQKGDITVYDGHGPYVAGHIAISLGGDAVFEENADPDEAPAHVFDNRSSTYLLGALRIKADEKKETRIVVDQALSDALYLFYMGTPTSAWGKANAIGKMTGQELQAHLLASDEYKALVTKAKAGQIDPVEHLPHALRSVYPGQKPTPLSPGVYQVK